MRLLTVAALAAASLAACLTLGALPANAQAFGVPGLVLPTSPPPGDPFSWSRLSKVDHPDIPNCNLLLLLQNPQAVCEQLPLMPPTDAGTVYFSHVDVVAPPPSGAPPTTGGDGDDGHHHHNHGHDHHHHHGHDGDDGHGHGHDHNPPPPPPSHGHDHH